MNQVNLIFSAPQCSQCGTRGQGRHLPVRSNSPGSDHRQTDRFSKWTGVSESSGYSQAPFSHHNNWSVPIRKISERLLPCDDPQLSEALAEDPERLKDIADPAINGTFAVDSLSTVADIAINCTAGKPSDRPSIDDVLWNLQYSMQVQDGWASSESLGMSVKSQA